jgi:hypothetical protein
MWSVVSPLGDEVPLAEMNVSVRAAPGAGMPPLDYPTNGRPTASIVRWQSEARRLTLRLETRRRAAALPTTRQALIRALNPDLVQPYGPAYLTYTGGTRPLRLPVVYEAGLEHEEASALELRLLALETTWAASAPVEHTLAVQAALDPAGYVLKRSAAGAWTTLGGLGSAPNVLLVAPDGTRYAGGAFAGGVARWDTATAAWVTLAGLEGPVRCLAWGPDGTLYAGGTFSTQGDTVAAYDGSTWTTLGIPGLAPHALAVGAEGTLYGGGVAAGGASVQRWQAGTGWLDMGTGPGGPAYSLLTDARGGLYAGGAFAGGAARWTGAAWEPLGDGLAQSDGSTPEVRALAAGPDGMLYAGGTFDRADGVLASNIARWNGLNWQPLGSGLDGAVLALAAVLAGGWAADARPSGAVERLFVVSAGPGPRHCARYNGAGRSCRPDGAGGQCRQRQRHLCGSQCIDQPGQRRRLPRAEHCGAGAPLSGAQLVGGRVALLRPAAAGRRGADDQFAAGLQDGEQHLSRQPAERRAAGVVAGDLAAAAGRKRGKSVCRCDQCQRLAALV